MSRGSGGVGAEALAEAVTGAEAEARAYFYHFAEAIQRTCGVTTNDD
jgi:hypothetical protein